MKKKPATPYPRKRKPFDVITNKPERGTEEENPEENLSALKRLHGVHSSVARMLDKIDALVTGIHKKKLAEKLHPEEIEDFNRAMSTIEATVQEWHDFFQEIAKRPTDTANHMNNDDLIPIFPTSHKSFLADSPLVPHVQHDFRKVLSFSPEMSPCRRVATPVSKMKKTRLGTPITCKKVTFANSPITITPVMPSPPRSVRQRRPSTSSSSSYLSTPSFLQSSSKSPASVKLETPEAPAEIVNKYSKWLCKPSPKEFERSPDIDVSPPKTCAFLNAMDGSAEDMVSPKPLLTSPFRTPGLALRSPSSVDISDMEKHASDLSSIFASVSL